MEQSKNAEMVYKLDVYDRRSLHRTDHRIHGIMEQNIFHRVSDPIHLHDGGRNLLQSERGSGTMNRAERRNLIEWIKNGGDIDQLIETRAAIKAQSMAKEMYDRMIEDKNNLEFDLYYNTAAIAFCTMFPKHKYLKKETSDLWLKMDAIIKETCATKDESNMDKLRSKCLELSGYFVRDSQVYTLKQEGNEE